MYGLGAGCETGRDSPGVSAGFGSGTAAVCAGFEVITFSFGKERPSAAKRNTAIRAHIQREGAVFLVISCKLKKMNNFASIVRR